MEIRFILHSIILITLSTTFFYHLYYTKNGFKAHQELCVEVEHAKIKQAELKHKIASLETELHDWQTDLFVKEKMAREDLLYSYTNEHVYIIPQATT